MTHVLLAILFFGGMGWFILSPLISIWWFFYPETCDRFTDHHEKIAFAVFLGSFFSFFFVLSQGIKELLMFIPASVCDKLSSISAFLLLCFFMYVFKNFGKMRAENYRLSILVEIQNRKDDLRYKSHEALIEKHSERETELHKLRKRFDAGRLSLDRE